jgi:hypothetical protein
MSNDSTESLPRRRLLQAAAAGAIAVGVGADDPKPAPTAKPEDVASIDSIIAALLGEISGPKGKTPDADRIRSLFLPEARLIPCTPKNPAGTVQARTFTVEGMLSRWIKIHETDGIFEREVARKVDRFGHIAQAWSTYELRREAGGEPILTGINSFQLLWDEKRWWIVTIFWDAETPENRIPAEYRPKA